MSEQVDSDASSTDERKLKQHIAGKTTFAEFFAQVVTRRHLALPSFTFLLLLPAALPLFAAVAFLSRRRRKAAVAG